MRKLLLYLLLTVCWPTISTASGIVLQVILKDGTQHEYIISERPQIKFGDDKVSFIYNNVTTDYAKSDLQNFVFTNPTGIAQLKTGDTRMTYSGDNDHIIVEGLDGKDQVEVYSISGIKQQVNINDTGHGLDICIGSLPKGYYIIKFGNKQSIKITKK